MNIIIPGKPIAKKRPRFARRGKFVMTYSDEEIEEGRWLLHLMQAMEHERMMIGPVEVTLFFLFARPKGHYGTGRNQGRLKDSAPRFHTVKRDDIDNCVKFALDCMNGVVFQDDCQVVLLRAAKAYTNDPTRARTEIVVKDA